MKCLTLVALSAFPYAGRTFAEGEVFEAPEYDAALLKLIKRAADAPPARARPQELEPLGPDASQDAASPSEQKPKRQYRRRQIEVE